MLSISRLVALAVSCVCLLACTSPELPSVQIAHPEVTSDLLLIQNVSVFDSESLETTAGQDVVVQDGLIAGVFATGGPRSTVGARVISGAGATLVPGLVDMHGHVHASTLPTWNRGAPDAEANLRAYAYAGVTTVFDPSDGSGEAFTRRERVARGELLGPRIFSTGKLITCPGGHPRAIVREFAPAWIAWYFVPMVASAVASDAEIHAVVDDLAASGADAVKIAIDAIPLDAPVMRREIARKIVARANSHGLRTVAHIGTTEDAIDAGEAGVALWVHGVYKERIPDAQIAQLASYGIPMVATIEVFDRYARATNGPPIPTKLERETVPQSVLDSFYPVPEDFELGAFQGWIDLIDDTRRVQFDNLQRLRAAGVTVLAGSDVQSGVFPGASLHRELAHLVASGMTPAEAIRAATLDSARFLARGQEPDFGSIARGKRADLLLVEGDPSRDIAALSQIREVFLNGVPIVRTPVQNTP